MLLLVFLHAEMSEEDGKSTTPENKEESDSDSEYTSEGTSSSSSDSESDTEEKTQQPDSSPIQGRNEPGIPKVDGKPDKTEPNA